MLRQADTEHLHNPMSLSSSRSLQHNHRLCRHPSQPMKMHTGKHSVDILASLHDPQTFSDQHNFISSDLAEDWDRHLRSQIASDLPSPERRTPISLEAFKAFRARYADIGIENVQGDLRRRTKQEKERWIKALHQRVNNEIEYLQDNPITTKEIHIGKLARDLQAHSHQQVMLREQKLREQNDWEIAVIYSLMLLGYLRDFLWHSNSGKEQSYTAINYLGDGYVS